VGRYRRSFWYGELHVSRRAVVSNPWSVSGETVVRQNDKTPERVNAKPELPNVKPDPGAILGPSSIEARSLRGFGSESRRNVRKA
jgi:hypothetical protein